ncbi:MAG: hypothetical protein ACRC5T_09705 [Cetobacterium sp.]
MIVMWEVHVETKHSIGDMLTYFKAKGVAADYKMCKDEYGTLSVKHPQQASVHDFKIKLYSKLGGVYRYEIGTWSKEQAILMEDWFKDI